MNKQQEKSRLGSLAHSCQVIVSFVCLLALSAAAKAVELNSVDYSSLPGDRVELRFGFDGTPPEPKGYNIEKPARIALDLVGVNSVLKTKYHELGLGNARNLTVLQAGNRTRLIVNLTKLEGYSTEIRENKLFLVIGGDREKGTSLAATTPTGTNDGNLASGKELSSGEGVQIRDVDFQRGVEGEGKIIISLSDPHAEINMRKEGDQLHVRFNQVKLPEDLVRRLDVVDFATPVREIDSTNQSEGALIAIKPYGDYEHLAYQTDNTYIVSVKPLSAEEAEKKKKKAFSYTGEKLSLNFQDIEVRAVLQLIADFTELNLVASDTVGGKITLRLQNVPWDQALDLILKTKGLDKRKVGNVMLVAPADEIAAREKLELEANKQVEALAPMQSEFFTIKYASAEDIKSFLSSSDSKISSERGSVVLDSRTNTLLIQDTANKLEEIRDIITQLDVPVRQVLIEARLVVASSNIADDLGVRWGGLGFEGGNSLNHVAGSSAAGIGTINSIDDDGNFGIPFPQAYVVDFGSTDPNASSMSIGILDNGMLQVELSAIESEGKAEVISTPKILTADSQEAEILSGTKFPYQTESASGGTTVAFVEAFLSLKVTPHITPDNRILMDLDIKQDSIAGEIQSGEPIVDVNQIFTHVLVANGDTIVLGGVFKTNDQNQVFKTPFFGDLPIVGRFFRRTISSSEKQELLVFITPKVVSDVLAAN